MLAAISRTRLHPGMIYFRYMFANWSPRFGERLSRQGNVAGSAVAILFLTLLSSPGLGTTGIVAIRPTKFWLAADSRMTNLDGEPVGGICKIRRAGDFYWIASTIFYSDPKTGFSVPQFVEAVAPNDGTLLSKADMFISRILIPLSYELRELRNGNMSDRLKYASIVTGQFQFFVVDMHH
jgi:hypothetical protein